MLGFGALAVRSHSKFWRVLWRVHLGPSSRVLAARGALTVYDLSRACPRPFLHVGISEGHVFAEQHV